MDINLSSVAVSGGRRTNLRQSARQSSQAIKPSASCNSCSDDQHSITSDTDREKSLNSCFTDNDSHQFAPAGHGAHPQNALRLAQNHQNPHERDLDSPDQDYDFNSRFSPPPTDTSYHSENHCNCYEDADNEHHDTDDSDAEGDFIGANRRTTQYRQKRRGHRNCTMDDDILQVTKDTVCIIESEARGGVSSARELNEKTMAATKARQQQQQQQQQKKKVLASPGSKSYHNICAGGRGHGANFGTVSGSCTEGGVCMNNGCAGGAEMGAVSNNRSHHQHGINEFMHGFAPATTPTAAGPNGVQMLPSYGPPQMKWSRNNIAVTMERYEPSTSSSSVSPCQSPNHQRPGPAPQPQSRHHFHQGHYPGAHNANFHHDYSYAYYEPGAAMRHANIPGSPSSAGPSTSSSHPLPPPNSIQALLLKSQGYQAKLKKQQQQQALMAQMGASSATAGNAQPGPSSRHAYTTRYGTQENIYEEIGNEDRMRMMMAASSANGQSMVSLNQSLVEEEFRQVHNRHRRILGELNLAVEAMIMPVNPPVEPAANAEESVEVHVHESPVAAVAGGAAQKPRAGKRNDMLMKPMRNPQLMGRTSDALAGGACGVTDCSQVNGDMDSGFSGSSSGASYIGSLRYAKSQCCPNATMMLPRTTQRGAYEDPGLSSFSTRSSSSYGSSKSSHNLQRMMMRSAEDPGPSSHHHHQHAAMALNGMPGTSATLKPMSKNASFWSRKGWKIIPGLTSPGNKTSSASNILSS